MTTIQEPRVRILITQDGTDELKQIDLQTDNRDRVRWDLIRSRKGWPASTDAPSLFMTILAWAALRRSGEDVESDPEKFIDRVVGVYGIDENGDLLTKAKAGEGTPVDPTQSGADTGS